tara:strand:+ start:303 stop:719 length:417 start_codon:yes stop_codon:yes gene_type:complete
MKNYFKVTNKEETLFRNVLNKNKNKTFVKRTLDPKGLRLNLQGGGKASILTMSNDNKIFPTVQQFHKSGKAYLKELKPEYAYRRSLLQGNQITLPIKKATGSLANFQSNKYVNRAIQNDQSKKFSQWLSGSEYVRRMK